MENQRIEKLEKKVEELTETSFILHKKLLMFAKCLQDKEQMQDFDAGIVESLIDRKIKSQAETIGEELEEILKMDVDEFKIEKISFDVLTELNNL